MTDRRPTPSEVSLRIFELTGLQPDDTVIYKVRDREVHVSACDDGTFMLIRVEFSDAEDRLRYVYEEGGNEIWLEVDDLADERVVEYLRWMCETAVTTAE